MSGHETTDHDTAMEPIATGFPGILASLAGLVGSMPIGLAAGLMIGSVKLNDSNWYAGALGLLGIVPFLLALVPAEAVSRGVALALAVFGGFGVGAMTLGSATAPFLFGLLVIPVGLLGLLLGSIALATSGHRRKDGSLALAILGLSPAGSSLAVYVIHVQVGFIQNGFPGLLQGTRPLLVFEVAVLVAVIAILTVALRVIHRRRAIRYRSKAWREWHRFDQP